jgi:hypothetical protein
MLFEGSAMDISKLLGVRDADDLRRRFGTVNSTGEWRCI